MRITSLPIRLALAAACLIAPAASLAAQGPGGPPEVGAAQAALRAGDPDSAIRTLESFYQVQRRCQRHAGQQLAPCGERQRGQIAAVEPQDVEHVVAGRELSFVNRKGEINCDFVTTSWIRIEYCQKQRSIIRGPLRF